MVRLGPTTRAASGVFIQWRRSVPCSHSRQSALSARLNNCSLYGRFVCIVYMMLPAYAPSLALQNQRISLITYKVAYLHLYHRRHFNLHAFRQLRDVAERRIKILRIAIISITYQTVLEIMKIQLIRTFLLKANSWKLAYQTPHF